MFDQWGRWLRRRQGIERNAIYRLAADVTEGRVPVEQAYKMVEQSAMLNGLADGDLWELDREAARAAEDDSQRALVITRLAILAARYKGFDRVLVDCNLRAAELLMHMGDQREQELHLREALHSAERIANIPGQRRALARLSRLAFDRGEADRARELLSRQLETGREDVDTIEDVDTAMLLGDLARNDNDLAGAREFYHRAARGARRAGHFAGVVDALLRQVVILRELGDRDAAVLLLQQAQDAAERTIDTRLQAEIAIQTGALQAENDQVQQAQSQLSNALDRARTINDLAMESRCLTGLAQIECRSSRLAEAAEHYQELADLERTLGNRAAAVRALLDAGQLFIDMRNAESAIPPLETAIQIAQSLDDSKLLQRSLGVLGLAHSALDHRSTALECLMGAVQCARKSSQVDEEGRWVLGIGEVLLQFGEYSDALAAARRSLEIAQDAGDSQLESQVHALIGSISFARGLYRDAEESLNRAVMIAHEEDDPGGELRYQQILAQLGSHSGQPQLAAKYLQQAMDVAAVYADAKTRTRLHGQAARLYQSLNQVEEAEEHYRSSLEAAKEASSPPLVARALRGLAIIQDIAGNVDGAVESYRQAVQLTEQLGDRRSAMALHYNLGALLYDLERDQEASEHLNQSVALAMELNDYATADDARSLLQWLSSSDESGKRVEDRLLGEIAVGGESDRPRDVPRE
jgi:tetratricopeptide (TPR) repeat protein